MKKLITLALALTSLNSFAQKAAPYLSEADTKISLNNVTWNLQQAGKKEMFIELDPTAIKYLQGENCSSLDINSCELGRLAEYSPGNRFKVKSSRVHRSPVRSFLACMDISTSNRLAKCRNDIDENIRYNLRRGNYELDLQNVDDPEDFVTIHCYGPKTIGGLDKSLSDFASVIVE